MTRRIAEIFAGLILVIAGFATAIYGFGADNRLTRNFERIIPLPAARVGSHFIPLWKVRVLESAYQTAAGLPGTRAPIMDKLIKDAVVSDLLQSPPAPDQYYAYLLEKFTPDSYRKLGLSEKDFKTLIVLPDYRRKQLTTDLNSQNTDSREYLRMVKIRELLDAGMDFSKAAEIYSEDEQSRYIGGDMGFMSLAELDPWLAPAAAKLGLNEVSKVIAAPDGYHILKIINKDETSRPARFQIEHILVRGADIDHYIDSQIPGYRIYTFIKIPVE